jgi:hypothetical protein
VDPAVGGAALRTDSKLALERAKNLGWKYIIYFFPAQNFVDIKQMTIVAKLLHFYATSASGKNFDRLRLCAVSVAPNPAPDPAPTLPHSKPPFFKAKKLKFRSGLLFDGFL